MRIDHNRFAEMDAVLSKHMPPRAPERADAPRHRGASAVSSAKTIWPWPGLIFVLLGVNVAVVAITIYFATSDASFAVEPDYYRKAMQWDDTMAQRQHNVELGWRIDLARTVSGQPIALRLLDRNDQPISGANIAMIAFHDAHAQNRLETTLEEIEPGLYRSSETLTRTGSWQIRMTARIGGETFTAAIPHSVTLAGAGR